MLRRDGGRIRMAIIACTGRPILARSTSSKAPRITPRSRSPRVRSSAVVGDTPTAFATSRLVRRASDISSRKISVSSWSNSAILGLRPY
jgi:hypothetical protein